MRLAFPATLPRKGHWMALTISFCLERAEEAAAEARKATLVNVRERALRSETAWRAMADRASEVLKNRAKKAQEAAEAQSRTPIADQERR
jgi:hypothetical protein